MSHTRWRATAAATVIAGVALVTAGWWWWRLRAARLFLDGKRKKLKLIRKSKETHDTLRLVFALEHEQQLLGACPGMHIIFYGPNKKGQVDGFWNSQRDKEGGLHEIRRKFTPISPVEKRGEVEILLKVYAGGHSKFPDGGKISQYLAAVQIGEEVTVSGPVEKIRYIGPGTFLLGRREVHKRKVGLLAGGSGIAPTFHLIRTVLENELDDTRLYLIFANKTERDILLRKELEEFAHSHPQRFKLWYTLDAAPAGWQYSVGYINA